jgi:large subunit ribosomal protein L6
MSKIGEKPIAIPEAVKIENEKGSIQVSGPKGVISMSIRPEIEVVWKEEAGKKYLVVTRKNDSKFARSLHGLVRTLIANMILGVTEGFEKKLKIIGTGYRVKIEEGNLVLNIGFSHQVTVKPPQGIEFLVKGTNQITITGVDKQLVGQTAAAIRHLKPPDVYKGKGIRYLNEQVRKKPGKAVKAATA